MIDQYGADQNWYAILWKRLPFKNWHGFPQHYYSYLDADGPWLSALGSARYGIKNLILKHCSKEDSSVLLNEIENIRQILRIFKEASPPDFTFLSQNRTPLKESLEDKELHPHSSQTP